MNKVYKKIPIGHTITLPKKVIDATHKWAEDNYIHFYNKSERPKEEIIHNIFIGKLGEIGKFKMYLDYGIVLKTTLSDIFKVHENRDDGGCDLILQNDLREDVKSIEMCNSYYNQVIPKFEYNTEKLRADAYSLCWVNAETGEVKYDGILTSKEILGKNLLQIGHRNDGKGDYKYFNRIYLKALNENLE